MFGWWNLFLTDAETFMSSVFIFFLIAVMCAVIMMAVRK